MRSRKHIVAAVLAGSLFWPGGAVFAAAPDKLSGSLVGFVSDTAGIPQMGATVLLFNRSERLVNKTLTNDKGAFGFDSLVPDLYSIRVTLASFVPAMKAGIAIQPGARSFLSINLASVLSSIELVYTAPGQGAIMNDDWKWVLRSSMSTRPILRIVPQVDISDPRSKSSTTAVLSRTRGMVRLSASDMGTVSTGASEPDLGTAFALATSLMGKSELQFSGGVGYSPGGGTPSAGFRTSFSRNNATGMGPEVALTMRQMFLPARAGLAFFTGRSGAAPALRTMSVSASDRQKLGDSLELEYGASLEAVSFIEHLNYFSPYARMSYAPSDTSTFLIGFSSGVPPATGMEWPTDDFQGDLAVLSAFPRVSLRGGTASVQRSENVEIGYRRKSGSRTYAVGVYRERASNLALSALAPAGVYGADLLPDLFSSSGSIFNIGDFERFGYVVSLTQNLGDNLSASAAYGNREVLAPPMMDSPGADQLRSSFDRRRSGWVSATLAGTSPWTGTRFVTSYEWTDYAMLAPMRRDLLQHLSSEPGWNVRLRQPIPSIPGMRGRLEATAELRNLLAQGYVPVSAQGKRLLLVPSPRSIRGGLSFIF